MGEAEILMFVTQVFVLLNYGLLLIQAYTNVSVIITLFFLQNNRNENIHEIDEAADLINNENQELSKQVLEATVVIQNQNYQIISLKQEIQALKTVSNKNY